MKLMRALSIGKTLYTASFGFTALGLVISLISDIISKYFYASALIALLAYAVVSAVYLRCPKCGQLIRIRPLIKQTNCIHCEYRFDSEE